MLFTGVTFFEGCALSNDAFDVIPATLKLTKLDVCLTKVDRPDLKQKIPSLTVIRDGLGLLQVYNTTDDVIELSFNKGVHNNVHIKDSARFEICRAFLNANVMSPTLNVKHSYIDLEPVTDSKLGLTQKGPAGIMINLYHDSIKFAMVPVSITPNQRTRLQITYRGNNYTVTVITDCFYRKQCSMQFDNAETGEQVGSVEINMQNNIGGHIRCYKGMDLMPMIICSLALMFWAT